MKTKKIYLIVLVVIVIGGLFWMLTNKSKPSDNNPIKIGASEALTGKFAFIGESLV